MVSVVGLGYIGLPTTLMLAGSGAEVIGVDCNADLVTRLQQGELTFKEEGLSELFHKARMRGVKFSTAYVEADVYIVAVPTPYIKTSKKVDASFVLAAVSEILNVCKKGSIICIESTVSPGTIDQYIRTMITQSGRVIGEDVHLVHAPERIIPGRMLYELENNSRIIGCDNIEVGKRVKEIYANFCKGNIVITDIKTAEMTKVIENTYRDINIAFANEIVKICRRDNMNAYDIIKIANMHPRVNILQPGPGVGGHCISVDPWFLVGEYHGLAKMTLAARKVNDSMPEFVLKRINDIMKEKDIYDIRKIGLYGLTYKEDVDDVRESPTFQLIEKMHEHLAYGIKVYDPYVKKRMTEDQYTDFEEFINDVDIVVIMVVHNHLKENIDKIRNKIVLDTRNICKFNDVYKL